MLRNKLVPLLLLATSTLSAQQICSKNSTPQQIDARIDQLIAQMTVAERISQLGDRAPAIPRLRLPGYNWWNEGLHGLARDGNATVFPQAIALAATWDPALLHAVGDVISTEARGKFNASSAHGANDTRRYDGLTFWSPNINIFRDPRWGRGQETYGEDPFLTATLGKQFVAGLQGDDPFYLKTVATPKHFAAHSGPETGRDSFNSVVSPHDLEDTYLPAFHALLTDGKAASMMCSYNAINGTPSCANTGTLQTIVRDQWHFSGYIVSDCDAVGNIAEYHHFAADAAHGAADALNAGVDLDCGSSYLTLGRSLAQGLVTEASINRSLHRLLFARLKLGLLDAPACTPYNVIAETAADTTNHRALALRAAEESIVLLKNDGILPLTQSGKRIAVIGPNADSLKVIEANYHGTAAHPVTILQGLQTTFKSAAYAQGSLLADSVPAPIPATAFRTSAEANASPGLNAAYFTEASTAGKPAFTAELSRIEFDLDRAAPDPRLPAGKPYAAVWSGFLVPPAPGDYLLHVNVERCWDCKTHDTFQLLLDGKPVLADAGPNRFTLHSTGTEPHAIQLTLLHSGEDEGITLEWQPPAGALLDEAVRTAKDADILVAVVGLSPDLEGEALSLNLKGFAGGDRTRLDLPAAQRTLLHRLQQLGKPLVIVLTTGSALALDPAEYGANALLEAWYPGEEGGDALAAILTGKVSPSGRLPVTFYRSADDLPAFSDYSMAHRTYRYFPGPVLYPFGFGLSYSHFTYSNVKVANRSGQSIEATVTLNNTGPIAASEVAELYLAPPQDPGSPRLVLAGTLRVTLKPAESRLLHFTLAANQFTSVDPAGHRMARSGNYRVFISGSQPDLTRDPGTPLHRD